MKHSTGKPTKYEAARMARIAQYGCLCCHWHGRCASAEVHHLISGGRRKGHRYTIGLCRFHHRNVGPAPDFCGPSLAAGSKAFEAHFGSQESLLERQDRLLTQFHGLEHPPIKANTRKRTRLSSGKVLERRA